MTNDRSPGASAPRAGGESEGEATTGAQRTLLSLLEMAFGSREPVHQVVSEGLRAAGRESLPLDGPDLVAFVRAHLLELLSDQIGPRLTLALVTDLVGQLDPGVPGRAHEPSAPPTSLTRPLRAPNLAPTSEPRMRPASLGVVLVDSDRIGRTALARALLRAQCEVTVVDAPADLDTALDAADPVDVALVDANHPAAQQIVRLLGRRRPGVPVVARSADAATTRALVSELTQAKVDVRSRDAGSEELIAALRRVMG